MINDVENMYPRFTQIVGDTGTGKTCSAIRFGEILTEKARERNINFKHVYINCKVDGSTRYVLFGNLIRKVTSTISTRSLSPEEMIRQLIDYLRFEGQFLLITFDEIDYFIKANPKEHIIYDLTRITEMNPGIPSPIIGEIFIARSLEWHKNLEPAERSSLGMGIIQYPGYTNIQIKEILEDRIKEALFPGTVGENTLNLLTDITANSPVNGDIRIALELLYYAGNMAENEGSKRILPDYVRKVYSETNPSITNEDIENLNEKSKLVLLALVRTLKTQKSAYTGLRDIRENYQIVCEELKVKASKKLEETVQDLIYRGIIEMRSLTEFGISGASLVDLEKFLSSLIEKFRREYEKKR
jgi:cell division control protein 6